MSIDCCFDSVYRNKRVFLTGHTGFKGSWMLEWLNGLGAKVSGYALPPPTTPSHFSLLNSELHSHYADDIRDVDALRNALRKSEPEIVFHLAAQPLVRRSYRDPLETFSTNVMGTANLLEAARGCESVRAVVVITTDKCYLNRDWEWGYRENDRLGGHDPYSASKACAELVASSFRLSFPDGPLIATARAGNVIGGGDWAEDRLIPDLIRAASKNEATPIRMPQATRPWQHVLEPLCGYLLLGKKLLQGEKEFADAWNIGPGPEDNLSVGEVVTLVSRHWDRIRCDIAPNSERHEASLLMLDCSKARNRLGWKPIWSLEEGIERTVSWYRDFYERQHVRTREQIEEFSSRLSPERRKIEGR